MSHRKGSTIFQNLLLSIKIDMHLVCLFIFKKLFSAPTVTNDSLGRKTFHRKGHLNRNEKSNSEKE